MEILGVTESTFRLLRQEIVMGKIPPGAKLNEIELANRYGVSRPPLREAFRKLEYENLVASIPRKGTYVTEISVEDCKQVYFTRRVIEGAAVDAIAQNKNPCFNDMRKAIEAGKSATLPRDADVADLMTYYDEIAGFHWKMVKASGNRWLIHCYRSIDATLTRYQLIYLAIPGTRQPSIQSHINILRFIEDGKYQAAKDRLDTHIIKTRQQLIDKMQDNMPIARTLS